MDVKPIRDYVVVKKNEAPKQTSGGIFVPGNSEEKVVNGVVVAAGSGHIGNSGTIIPLEVRVGDKIAFNRNMAVEVKVNETTYLLLREEHILCVVNS